MKKLHLTFLNEDRTKKTLVLHCVHQDLSPEAVKEAMEQISELDLFEKDGVRLMTEVHSAKYVEVIETPLFDNEAALPVPVPIVEAVVQEDEELVEADVHVEKSDEVEEIPDQKQEKSQKQLAKIYPFMTRAELNLKRQEFRQNQKTISTCQGSYRTSNQVNCIECVTPLIQPTDNKDSLRSTGSLSSRGSP